MNPTPRSLIAIVLTAASLCSAPATAQSLSDRYWFELGGYFPAVDSKARVSSDGTAGTDVDFEKDLDLDHHETLPAFSAGARIGHSFRVTLEYYSLDRKGSTDLSRNIVFDDVTYPVSGTVSSNFNSDVYRATVGWSFVRKPNYEFGAAIGFHGTEFEIGLSGNGTVNGTPGQFESRRRKLFAPVPTIGLYGAYEVAPNLELGGNLDWLSLRIGDYDGRLLNTEAKLTYRVMKNVGLGIGYRYVDYRVDVKKPDWTGRLTYQFHGPTVFVQAGF
jgi:opacity protein-like surface antigen